MHSLTHPPNGAPSTLTPQAPRGAQLPCRSAAGCRPPTQQPAVRARGGCAHKEHRQRGLAACPRQGQRAMRQNYLSPENQGSPPIVNSTNLKLPFTKRFLHLSTCAKGTITGYPKPHNNCCYYTRAGNRPPPGRHTFYCILAALLLWTPRSWLDSAIENRTMHSQELSWHFLWLTFVLQRIKQPERSVDTTINTSGLDFGLNWAD